ncbi:ferric reductase-like transmembrane domain-containing protein [Nocardia sp. NPDC056064]|uniref:ferric reductase-like transmembrane domain-containing protein n=1 Tax=Nocardia sp. NPDC056064 TaxID=3345701 RepID=UPI0035D631D1
MTLSLPRSGIRPTTALLWLIRALPAVALAVLVQQVLAIDSDRRLALAAEAPDIVGSAALFTLAATMAVTPLVTLTGWRGHIPLRRDLGLWTVALGTVEVAVSVLTASTGWLDAVAGTAFLAAGTAAVVLAVPLALTSYPAAQRFLGRQWKVLHRLAHGVVLLVIAHVAFLGLDQIILVTVLFGPSYLLRIPVVRRRVVALRRERSTR